MEENNNKKNEPLSSKNPDSSQNTLRVAEALGKDVGRGLARLDPKDLERLGIQVGDIIQIQSLPPDTTTQAKQTGKRTTVAKAMLAFKEARGKGKCRR
jgi:transitional endoplasmic reticulum ATPase